MVCGCWARVAPWGEVAPVQGVDGGRVVLVGGMGVGKWWRRRPEPRVVLQAAGMIYGTSSHGQWATGWVWPLGVTNNHGRLNKTAGESMSASSASKSHINSFNQI